MKPAFINLAIGIIILIGLIYYQSNILNLETAYNALNQVDDNSEGAYSWKLKKNLFYSLYLIPCLFFSVALMLIRKQNKKEGI